MATRQPDSFVELAKGRGLSDETIRILVDNGFDSETAIERMKYDKQLPTLKIKLGHQNLIVEWITQLRSQSTAANTTKNVRPKKDPKASDITRNVHKTSTDSETPYKYPGKKSIAVTGRQSSGKSSLINTLRGTGPKDPSAAIVGIGHTPTGPKSYEYPHAQNIMLWDLPGVDTKEFPFDHYCELTYFDTYDVIIICTSEKFSEQDLILTDRATKLGKQCLLVRTKVDASIRDDRDDHGPEHNEEELLNKMYMSMFDQLPVGTPAKIYLLSTKLSDQEKWQFPELRHDMQDIGAIPMELTTIASKTTTATMQGPAIQNHGQAEKLKNDCQTAPAISPAVVPSIHTTKQARPDVSHDVDLQKLRDEYQDRINDIVTEAVTLKETEAILRCISDETDKYSRSFGQENQPHDSDHFSILVQQVQEHVNNLMILSKKQKGYLPKINLRQRPVPDTQEVTQAKNALAMRLTSYLTQTLQECFHKAKKASHF